MKVLVTGASGLLGAAVASRIADAGHPVRTFQRRPSGLARDAADVASGPGTAAPASGTVASASASGTVTSGPGTAAPASITDCLGSITDPAAVRRAVKDMDAIVHLAAKVSVTGPEHVFRQVNVEGTACLLKSARSAGVRDFLFISSPSVVHSGTAIAGEDAAPATPGLARGNYSRTKAEAELLVLAAAGEGFRTTAIRPHIVWGPGDTQLVERVLARAAEGRLPVLDSGAALIDTTYIDNAADAIAAGLGRMDRLNAQAVVVSNGEPRPIGELLAGICRAGGVPAPRRRLPGGAARVLGAGVEKLWQWRGADDEPPLTRFLAEQMSTAHWFDQRRTRELLDWTPAVSIDEGLARLAQHYRR